MGPVWIKLGATAATALQATLAIDVRATSTSAYLGLVWHTTLVTAFRWQMIISANAKMAIRDAAARVW